MANLLNTVFSYLGVSWKDLDNDVDDDEYDFAPLDEVEIKKHLTHVGIMKIDGINVEDMSKKDIVSFLEKHYSLAYNYDTKYPRMCFEYYTHFNCSRPFKVCIETFSDMNFVEVSIYTQRYDETGLYNSYTEYIKINKLFKLHVNDVFVPRSNNLESFIGSSILVYVKDNSYILVGDENINLFETKNKITHFFSDDAGGSGAIVFYMRDSENWYYFNQYENLEIFHDKHNLLNDVRCVGFYYTTNDIFDDDGYRKYKFFESKLNKSDDVKELKFKCLYNFYSKIENEI